MFSPIMENWLLRLLSIVFAVVLWFFVMGEQRLERSYLVPLELGNVPEGLMVANEVPSRIDVRISGPRTLLINLDQGEMGIPVDLDGAKPGVVTFRRLEEYLDIPSGLKVTRVSPALVDVRLDRQRTRRLAVKAEVTGVPAEGYRVAAVTVKPALAQVEGAESELKNLKEILTESVAVEGVAESFIMTVPLIYQGDYSRLVEPSAVELEVKIEPIPPSLEDQESQE